MPPTDEDIDAQLEKVQQNITRTLQSIDQNFERCNQTISGSIIPEVDNFTKASKEIWEHSKTWLHFFHMQAYGTTMDTHEPRRTTNRPPFTDTPLNTTFTDNNTQHTSTLSSVWERLHRDMHKQQNYELSTPGTDTVKGIFRPSRILDRRNLKVARALHQQIHNTGDFSSTQSSSMYAPTVRLLGINDDLDSINNSSNSDHQSPTPGLKRGTPIHQFTTAHETTSTSTSNKKARYGENPMLQPPDSVPRSDLMHRLEQAQQQPLSRADIDKNDTSHHHHQYLKSTPGPSQPTPITNLVNTPTMERVLKNSSKDYRELTKQKLQLDEPAFATPMQPESPPALDDMAYEFSPLAHDTPHSRRDTASSHGLTASTSSMLSMMSGMTGQAPAQFALHHFPETFREPPASVRLAKLYNIFADRPGQMLDWPQVVNLMRADHEDAIFVQDSLRILVDLLKRKGFLRRVGESWTLRR